MTIWEQVDAGKAAPVYSWMLSRSFATRSEMIRWGWKWISGSRGCRGVFVTNDPVAVDRARAVLRLDAPRSNGTHEKLGVPMHDVVSARAAVRAEYATAGLDADAEIEGFDTMTADQLADEIAYLGDYQG